MMPSKHRGWALVLVGGLGAAGGYFAASGFSALLQPFFGWRILWILNLPTGLSLVLLGAFIPESAKFLLSRGRKEEAQRVMERFGSTARRTRVAEHVALDRGPSVALTGRAFFGTLFALSLAAICFSLINFGLLLWLPADLIEKGYSVGLSSRLLAESALIAFPTVFLVAYLYSRWSTKWSVVGSIALTLAGLAGVLALEFGLLPSPVFPVALLIIGSNALIAMLLPYAAESFPLRIRGRTTGTVAACTKAGGMAAQLIAMFALVPPMAVVSIIIIVPTVLALVLVGWFGKETRGRDLRDLDPDARTFAATGM
jgi:putative MFS transporter